MYNSGKIIIGIIVFLILFTSPIWYDLAFGNPTIKPKLVLPTGEDQKECVMTTEYMRHNHMELLNVWRDDVVRNGDRIFTAASGKKFEMSLTKTCISCHSNKDEFCDQCHNYLGVNPYCWDCHVEPPKPEIK
ncbi:MAG: sulfate reduction electron transfer complex DsrMKJOP subunit DsrJ [Ignavibacteriaceae bacterium]